MASNSIVLLTGDGTTTEFNFSFTGGYMSPDDVLVRIGGEVDGAGNPVHRSRTFLNAGRIAVGGAVPVLGEEVKIYRRTPIQTPINDFANGTILDAVSLDRGFEQVVKTAQELFDATDSAFSAANEAASASLSAAEAKVSQTEAKTSETRAEADRVQTAADRAAAAASAASAIAGGDLAVSEANKALLSADAALNSMNLAAADRTAALGYSIDAGVSAGSAANNAAATASDVVSAGVYASNAEASARETEAVAIHKPGVRNLFMSTFFTDQDNHKVNFCTSNDGDTFSTLNASALSLGSDDVVELRDPSPIFFNNEWWYFGTGSTEGSYDFVVMKSSSVLPEVKHRVALGGGPYYSATIPYPGGTAPASSIWAPEPFIDDGKLYIAIAIRYGADFTNAYGNTGQHMKSFISECLDPDQMLFGTPVPIDFGADTQSLIDASIVKEGSTYWCAVKDDDQKNIRIYSASTRTGTYALNQVLGSSEYSLEAPCFVPYYYQSLGSDTRRTEWVLYCDYNRTGPTAADPDVLVGWPVYFRCTEPDNPGGVYGAMQTAHFETPVRHGSIINLADFPFEAAFGVAMIQRTPGRKALVDRVDLGSSNAKIKPQPGRTYFVAGSNNSLELTVEDGPADEFFLQVSASSDGTGITVLENADVAGPLYLGYGLSSDTTTRMIRSTDSGQYYADGYSYPANLMAAQTHTISGGAITIGLQEFVIVGTQDGAAIDDLDTINPPTGVENLRIHLRSVGSAEDIVLKHGTGNIQTSTAADITLDKVRDGVTLIYRGGFWRQHSAAAV